LVRRGSPPLLAEGFLRPAAGCLEHQLTVEARQRVANRERSLVEVNVGPSQTEKLTATQAEVDGEDVPGVRAIVPLAVRRALACPTLRPGPTSYRGVLTWTSLITSRRTYPLRTACSDAFGKTPCARWTRRSLWTVCCDHGQDPIDLLVIAAAAQAIS